MLFATVQRWWETIPTGKAITKIESPRIDEAPLYPGPYGMFCETKATNVRTALVQLRLDDPVGCKERKGRMQNTVKMAKLFVPLGGQPGNSLKHYSIGSQFIDCRCLAVCGYALPGAGRYKGLGSDYTVHWNVPTRSANMARQLSLFNIFSLYSRQSLFLLASRCVINGMQNVLSA